VSCPGLLQHASKKRPPIDCDYLVIGGGFAGIHCARKLADAGFHVTVLESADQLMDGASRRNMARIHHGWHYPGSAETARSCIPAAFDFLEEFGDVLLRSGPARSAPLRRGLCLLASGSFTAPDAWLAQAETLRAAYAAELARRAVTFGPASEFFQVLDQAEWGSTLVPEKIQLAASTLEPLVNLVALSTKLTREVQQHPRICALTGHEVVNARSVERKGGSRVELAVAVHGGSVLLFRASRVINASWAGRRELDLCLARQLATASVPSTTYRLRAILRVELLSDLRFLPTLLAVHGPFFTFSNCGDGTGLMMYEPVSNVATMQDHIPPEWAPIMHGALPPGDRAQLAQSILDGVSGFVPALRRARPMEVMGSVLYHCGRADIYDPRSEVHHRLGTGMKLIGKNWISLDTGKLSWIPRYVDEVVQYCTKERLEVA
jgi:glycine/D-amino acid oxidase-like deaminating enzyme